MKGLEGSTRAMPAGIVKTSENAFLSRKKSRSLMRIQRESFLFFLLVQDQGEVLLGGLSEASEALLKKLGAQIRPTPKRGSSRQGPVASLLSQRSKRGRLSMAVNP